MWWGIIGDALEAVRMSFPGLFLQTTNANLSANTELGFGLLFGVPVMIGWSFILFWADRKPVKRRGVLICLIPVIIMYVGISIYALSEGICTPGTAIPTFALQAVLLTLCITSLALFRNYKECAGGLA